MHHLPEGRILWETIKRYAKPGTAIVVMDLLRPGKPYIAKSLVDMYAATEPEVLQRDFYNSFLASFTLDEIKAQLNEAGLPLSAEQISDRHVFIAGVMA